VFDAAPQRSANLLLAGLTESEFEYLAPHLEPVELAHAMQVEAPDEPIVHAYFPASGLASVIAQDRAGRRIEAGLFGREGMTALSVVMGDDRSPNETTFQIAGSGHRIATDALREAMRAEPAIRDRFLLFAHAFAIQTAQTALANGKHSVEERLARWLLMCQDRVGGYELHLTHEFLSIMLGVRRAGVTVTIHILEGRHLIKAKRGCIRVVDRDGLKAAARGSYGVTEAEYARLLGVSLNTAEQASEAAE
jgi:CRP-like cAMP-binding protein